MTGWPTPITRGAGPSEQRSAPRPQQRLNSAAAQVRTTGGVEVRFTFTPAADPARVRKSAGGYSQRCPKAVVPSQDDRAWSLHQARFHVIASSALASMLLLPCYCFHVIASMIMDGEDKR